MKKYLVYIALGIIPVFFTGCSKEESDIIDNKDEMYQESLQNRIVGGVSIYDTIKPIWEFLAPNGLRSWEARWKGGGKINENCSAKIINSRTELFSAVEFYDSWFAEWYASVDFENYSIFASLIYCPNMGPTITKELLKNAYGPDYHFYANVSYGSVVQPSLDSRVCLMIVPKMDPNSRMYANVTYGRPRNPNLPINLQGIVLH